MPIPVIGPLFTWITSLAVAAASDWYEGAELRTPPEDELEIGSAPGEVVRAVAEEIVQQAPPERREDLRRVLLEDLTRGNPRGAQLAVPVDIEGAPSSERIEQIALAVGEAWEAPVRVTVEHASSGDGEAEYPVVLVTVGSAPAGTEWIGASHPAESYGGILDTIVQTVVSSAVGTVTSMGVQSLVNSVGGERRLARLVVRYKRAKKSGNGESVVRIKEKITRSASRIKGRKVDWSEIEAIVA